MKKLTLLLLLMVSTNVMAEWTKVGKSKDGDMTVYVDFGTIKEKGHKVKMWDLFDHKTVQIDVENERYLSTLIHNEYDCEEDTIQLLDIYWYSGNMRGGEIVSSQTNLKDETETRSILPDTIQSVLFKKTCGKK